MAKTQADAAVLESTAKKFEDVNGSLEGMLRRLLVELEGLRDQWKGHGGGSFEQVKQAWASDQAMLHRALAETATAIRTSGREYSMADSEASGRLTATYRGGQTLPL